MKVNVAVNFIERVFRITTNKSMEHQKFIVFQHLRKNNYPASMINRLLCRVSNKRPPNPASSRSPPIHNPAPAPPPPLSTPPTIQSPTDAQLPPTDPTADMPPTDAPPPTIQDNVAQPTGVDQRTIQQNPPTPALASSTTIYRSIPFIPQLTTNIAHILKADYPQVRLAYRTVKTTKQILRQVKDPIPEKHRSKVIYSIPCTDCPMTYIGMTKNKLTTRLSGHQTHINRLAKLRLTQNTQSDADIARLRETTALMDHMINNNHKFDLTKTTILDQARRESALPILEMCHITNTTNTVNFRTDVEHLNTTYAGILHTIKNQKSRKQRRNDMDNNTLTENTRQITIDDTNSN